MCVRVRACTYVRVRAGKRDFGRLIRVLGARSDAVVYRISEVIKRKFLGLEGGRLNFGPELRTEFCVSRFLKVFLVYDPKDVLD